MTPSGQTIVSLRNVGKTFERGTVALERFNLDVRSGEFVSLLGPSGCGKTTALRIVAGLGAASAGTAEWPAAAAGRIGFVFQDPTLMPWADVADNVRLPLKLSHTDETVARARARRAGRFRAQLFSRIVRRHAHARLDRARWSPSRNCC